MFVPDSQLTALVLVSIGPILMLTDLLSLSDMSNMSALLSAEDQPTVTLDCPDLQDIRQNYFTGSFLSKSFSIKISLIFKEALFITNCSICSPYFIVAH